MLRVMKVNVILKTSRISLAGVMGRAICAMCYFVVLSGCINVPEFALFFAFPPVMDDWIWRTLSKLHP